jgi:hypothetical protein
MKEHDECINDTTIATSLYSNTTYYDIIGNAIYCLRDPGFADYRRRVQAAFPPREAGGFPGTSYTTFH